MKKILTMITLATIIILAGCIDDVTPPDETPQEGVNNPLSYVAEYNVNPAGDGFVTSLINCSVSGYFAYEDAVDQFSDITIGDKRYHLPSIEEWRGIVPGSSNYVNFTSTNAYDDAVETVTVQGKSITMNSDFRTGVEGISYALRYKGTDLVSAWRYEYISDGNDSHMKVTSRDLQGQAGVTVGDIAQEGFWSTNAGNDVIRYFPASGFLSVQVMLDPCGSFWSSSPYDYRMGWAMYFDGDHFAGVVSNLRFSGRSVRLFSSGT